MKKILIYGHKSFLAKNFIFKYKKKYQLFIFKNYFKNESLFINSISKFIKKNKISYLINFAGNNDNTIKSDNFYNIVNSNFKLASTLLNVANKYNVTIFLFLSKDMSKSNDIQNFYSLSKLMLKSFIKTTNHKTKIRLLDLDAVYGPFDFNNNRLIPSIMLRVLKKYKNKKKIYLKQKKKLIYVDDVNKKIAKLLVCKKKYVYNEIPAKKYDIFSIYNYLKRINNNSSLKRRKYRSFVETLKWYKKFYESKT